MSLLSPSAAVTVPADRPELPSDPTHHPVHWNWMNYYDPDALVNCDQLWELKWLHDCWGERSHRAYLVEWDIHPLQLTWV